MYEVRRESMGRRNSIFSEEMLDVCENLILNKRATYNFCMSFFLGSREVNAGWVSFMHWQINIGRGQYSHREHIYYDYEYDSDEVAQMEPY